jgi:hypothetical protein
MLGFGPPAILRIDRRREKNFKNPLTIEIFRLDSAPTLSHNGADMSLKDQPPVQLNKCTQVLECNRKWRDLLPTNDINVRHCAECKREVHNIRVKDLLKWKPRDGVCIYIDFEGLAKLYPQHLTRAFPYLPQSLMGVAMIDVTQKKDK